MTKLTDRELTYLIYIVKIDMRQHVAAEVTDGKPLISLEHQYKILQTLYGIQLTNRQQEMIDGSI